MTVTILDPRTGAELQSVCRIKARRSSKRGFGSYTSLTAGNPGNVRCTQPPAVQFIRTYGLGSTFAARGEGESHGRTRRVLTPLGANE
jgi:hypothetical protein